MHRSFIGIVSILLADASVGLHTVSSRNSTEGKQCLSRFREAKDLLGQAGISAEVAEAALLAYEGHPEESASRHSKLWAVVAAEQKRIAEQSMQAADLEATADSFSKRVKKQEAELFAAKDRLLSRVKSIRHAQSMRVGSKKAALKANITDAAASLQRVEQQAGELEIKKQALVDLRAKLDSAASAIRERKAAVAREDGELEALQNLVGPHRAGGDSNRTGKALRAQSSAQYDALAQALRKGRAQVNAGKAAISNLLGDPKSASNRPKVEDAMGTLSRGISALDVGGVVIASDKDALEVAKDSMLGAMAAFQTAHQKLSECLEGRVPVVVTPAPATTTQAPSTASSVLPNKHTQRRALQGNLDRQRGRAPSGRVIQRPTKRTSARADSKGSSKVDPSELLRQKLEAFRSAAEEASKESSGNSRSSDGLPEDFGKKVRQLFREVDKANTK